MHNDRRVSRLIPEYDPYFTIGKLFRCYIAKEDQNALFANRIEKDRLVAFRISRTNMHRVESINKNQNQSNLKPVI